MRRHLLTIVAGLILASSAAQADDCVLRRAPVDLVPNSNAIVMDLKIGDRPAQFMLDTGAIWSIIRRGEIGDLMPQKRRTTIQAMGGGTSDETVIVPSLKVGTSELHRVEMFIVPDEFADGDDIAGVIGAHLLQPFDLEINLLENKLNFLTSSNCGARVVYWKNDGFTVAPLRKDKEGHIFAKIKIDGRELNAMIDTGAEMSVLNPSVADSLFNLKPGDRRLEGAGEATDATGKKLPMFRHRFEKLEIAGLAIRNPWITLIEGRFGWIEGGDSGAAEPFDFILGLHQMRDPHLYISYPENKMYITKASVQAASGPGDFTDPAPVSAPMVDGLDAQLWRPYIDRIEAATRDNHPELVLSILDDLVEHFPGHAAAYYARAVFEAQSRDNDAALSDLNHAIALLPSYAEAYWLRGAVRHVAGDQAGANEDFNTAIKFAPKSAEAYRSRGDQRRFLHDYQAALADYEQALSVDQKDAASHERRGEVLYHLGRRDEAADSFAHAVDLSPASPGLRNARCWYLGLMGRYEQALPECDKGVEMAPKWDYMLDSRGYVYLKLHRLKEAIADFDAAIDINPNGAHALYARSLAKQELGDATGAKADLAAAQKIRPDIAQHFPE
jgi:tetratricopeptide (TPR) repeat protein/predicted aspartyl protease